MCKYIDDLSVFTPSQIGETYYISAKVFATMFPMVKFDATVMSYIFTYKGIVLDPIRLVDNKKRWWQFTKKKYSGVIVKLLDLITTTETSKVARESV